MHSSKTARTGLEEGREVRTRKEREKKGKKKEKKQRGNHSTPCSWHLQNHDNDGPFSSSEIFCCVAFVFKKKGRKKKKGQFFPCNFWRLKTLQRRVLYHVSDSDQSGCEFK
jgi:hypothetical protein